MQGQQSFFPSGGVISAVVVGAWVLLITLAANSALAQTVTTVFNFNGANGANPYFGTLIQGRDGKLYGTTYSGGAQGLGTVFRINPATNFETVLHSFEGSDGAFPLAGLTLAGDGNFYGTTFYGGNSGAGVLYRMNSGGTFTVLHEFQRGADGGYPYGPPIEASDGNLYGVTSGDNTEAPTLYEYTRSGQYSIVYTFDLATTGWDAYGLIQGIDGLLYVTAGAGGIASCGAIAKLTLSGALKATHAFRCGHGGAYPTAPLIQASDGNYYGTTLSGGSRGDGVLFRLNAVNGENVLYEFGSGSNSAWEPEAGLVQGSDGNLYGVTFAGMGGSHLYRWSFVNGYADLATFTGTGELSAGMTQNTNGVFYGPSWGFGTYNDGYVYAVDMGLAPFITFVRARGKVGSSAQILGNGLLGATSVTFNGVPASFTAVSDTYLTAAVPADATSGPVVVNTSDGTLTSNRSFTVAQ